MKKILIPIISIIMSLLIIVKFSDVNYKNFANATWSITWPTYYSDIFYEFKLWRKWQVKDFDQIFILLNALNVKPNTYDDTRYSYLQDFNWDWLTDLAYIKNSTFYNNQLQKYEYAWYYSLLINKWNLEYEIAYRCVTLKPTTNKDEYPTYYWDCAK